MGEAVLRAPLAGLLVLYGRATGCGRHTQWQVKQAGTRRGHLRFLNLELTGTLALVLLVARLGADGDKCLLPLPFCACTAFFCGPSSLSSSSSSSSSGLFFLPLPLASPTSLSFLVFRGEGASAAAFAFLPLCLPLCLAVADGLVGDFLVGDFLVGDCVAAGRASGSGEAVRRDLPPCPSFSFPLPDEALGGRPRPRAGLWDSTMGGSGWL